MNGTAEPAVCGLDVVYGVLGAEPRRGDVLDLSRSQHLRLVRALCRTFSRWEAPDTVGGFRAVLESPMYMLPGSPVRFTSTAIFAQQIVAPDPVDVWLNHETVIDLSALDAAIEDARSLRKLVDAGVLILAPRTPPLRRSHPIQRFLELTEGIAFDAEVKRRDGTTLFWVRSSRPILHRTDCSGKKPRIWRAIHTSRKRSSGETSGGGTARSTSFTARRLQLSTGRF